MQRNTIEVLEKLAFGHNFGVSDVKSFIYVFMLFIYLTRNDFLF
jgi:hypothetical protein